VSERGGTALLYFDDPYLKDFAAEVTKVVRGPSGTLIELDKTAFHPRGGGQPGDSGFLVEKSSGRKIRVSDTQVLDESIVHLLAEGEIPPIGTVEGVIDWDRRFLLMRLHTAEHILSKSLQKQLPDAGVEKIMLDESHGGKMFITPNTIPWKDLVAAEEASSRLIEEGIDVSTGFFESPALAKASFTELRIKEARLKDNDSVRVVSVGDFDAAACTGTHVRNTREIGFMKITGISAADDGTLELRFEVGDEALDTARRLANAALETSAVLKTAPDKIARTASNLKEDFNNLKEAFKNASRELSTNKVGSLAESIETIGDSRILIGNLYGLRREEVIEAANKLVKEDESLIAILVGGAHAPVLVLARGRKSEQIDLLPIGKMMCGILGGGCGGKSSFVSGCGTKAENVGEALNAARDGLIALLKKKDE